MLVAFFAATHLMGAADASGLRWESPSKTESTASQATGGWKEAGTSWSAPSVAERMQPTPSKDSGRATHEDSARTARPGASQPDYDPFEEPFAKTGNALRDSRGTGSDRNPLRDDQLQPIAHHEPAAIEGPSFTEAPMPTPDDGSPPMRSVLVDRSNENPQATETSTPRVAAQPATGWRSNRVSRRQIPPDPFETEPSIPRSETPTESETTPNILPDAEPVEPDVPVEPRPLEAPANGRQPAEDAREPFENRQPEPDEDRDVPSVPYTEPIDLDVDDDDSAYEEEYVQEREQSQEDCNEYQRLLKAHTLRPWRDTQKEGWDQRPGDEIRDLLNIRTAGREGTDYPFECAFKSEPYSPRSWAEITYLWKASALCHKPLYFEDVQLERYGHSWGPFAQPLISGAHFFVTIPILPYKMGLKTPNECVYTLGHYRPGNCAPYLIDPIPFTWRAAVWQAGAVVGVSAIVP